MPKRKVDLGKHPEETKEMGSPELGKILKSSMAEQSISMRKLSSMCGICTASISRIMNHKQPANIHHLQEFSKHLGIPIEKLLFAVGIGKEENIDTDSYFMIQMIQGILISFELDLHSVIEDVKKELIKFEQYAKTEEGKNVIHHEFETKINKLNSSGIMIDHLHHLYERFCSEDTDIKQLPMIGSALLYFILSADVIPDYVFPIGYLDDAIAINLVLNRLT